MNLEIGMNNEEKFKSLSSDVLAEVLNKLAYEGFCNNWNMLHTECNNDCKKCIKDWLKQEMSEEEWDLNLYF